MHQIMKIRRTCSDIQAVDEIHYTNKNTLNLPNLNLSCLQTQHNKLFD